MVKIGLEIHVQLKTRSKLFCTCPTNFLDVPPNTNVCPICTAQPGAKPMAPNEEAIRKAVRVALALGCRISPSITFLRKHYFYPDLPNNYQRTSTPIAVDGQLGNVRIREIHVEEDPGRYELRDGVVDYNRCGVALIEIVTEPDMHSPKDAAEFLKQLKAVLEYLDVVLYPQVLFRVDANVSVEGGNRVEVKNINSISSVEKALAYEITRQKRLLQMGKTVSRETRHWDETRGITVSLRAKETAEDYRYIPDPDLLPILIPKRLVEEEKRKIPELPHQKEERFVREYGIKKLDAHAMVLDKKLADLFEEFANKYGVNRALEVCMRLRGELNYRGMGFSEVKGPERVISLLSAYAEGRIPKPLFVNELRKALDDPTYLPKLEEVVVDVEKLALDVIQEFPKAVEDYLAGKSAALNFLVGQVLKKARGRADPKEVRETIKRVLDKRQV